MGLVTLPAFGSDPVTVTAEGLDGKVDPLATEFNGNIENVNIKAAAGIVYSKLNLSGSILNADISASAAIADSKLAQITTASKVHGSSITGLASLPSGAGIVPIANLGTGTPDGTKFLRDDGVFYSAASTVASQTEMETATSNTVYVTPGRAQYHPGSAKAWAFIDGTSGTPSVTAGHNVASVTDLGVGNYRINFTTNFSSGNFCAVATADDTDSTANTVRITATAVGSVTIQINDFAGAANDAKLHIVCFGDQ